MKKNNDVIWYVGNTDFIDNLIAVITKGLAITLQ